MGGGARGEAGGLAGQDASIGPASVLCVWAWECTQSVITVRRQISAMRGGWTQSGGRSGKWREGRQGRGFRHPHRVRASCVRRWPVVMRRVRWVHRRTSGRRPCRSMRCMPAKQPMSWPNATGAESQMTNARSSTLTSGSSE
eukprot:scaffold7944_cov131-Isochrysis_galbana.AAC.9